MVVNIHSDCILIEKSFLSLYFLLNCQNSNNQFESQILIMIFDLLIFFIFSVILGGLLSEQSNFHLAVNSLRNFTSPDLWCNYFALKFPNPYNSKIF